MSQDIFSSTFCIVLIILASKFSHNVTQELPSQAESPVISDQFTTDQLRELLEILDAPSSKEVNKFQSHPLLHLVELLLDDDVPQNHDTSLLFSSITPIPTPTTTTTTTTATPTSPSQLSRRDDSTLIPLPTQPSQEQLVQQLSLFNSLLMSLSADNNGSTTTTLPQEGPPPLNEQQSTLLKSLFGNFTPFQMADPSQFLKRQTESPQNQTPSPSSPEIAALTELLTKIAKAPTDANGNLNLQSITGGGVNADHLKNFHNSNANMDPAASNQLSGLLTLLGTLGSLSQVQQQLQPSASLFNFGTTPSAVPISNNFLTGLLQPQAQSSQQSPNIFGNLFNQQPQVHEVQQPFNFGGIGSVISTVSNMLGGSGAGGKPRVRGKGVDTRLGLGYRFGDAADAQVMWDIGPQLFTDPLQNESPRYPMTKQKRHDSSHASQIQPSLQSQQIQAAAQAEKEQQQLAASRRYYQLHPPRLQQYPSVRRTIQVNPPTTRKPSTTFQNLTPYAQEQALKELWQMVAMKKQLERIQPRQQLRTKQFSYSPNVLNSLTPADLYQIQRQKQIIKRASTPSILPLINSDPTYPSVSKNANEPYEAESFLRFRKLPPSPNNAHSSNSKKSVPQRNSSQNPPQQSGGGLFNLNLFGKFRGPLNKHKLGPRPSGNRPESGGMMTGSPSQMSRWDMENHRFDNFKNTNGELVMTDSNSNDRFYVRNNANVNRNGGLVGA